VLDNNNNVAKYIHFCFCKAFVIDCVKVWWNHCPVTVIDTERYLIMWDKAVITDMPVAANRLDIIFTDN